MGKKQDLRIKKIKGLNEILSNNGNNIIKMSDEIHLLSEEINAKMMLSEEIKKSKDADRQRHFNQNQALINSLNIERKQKEIHKVILESHNKITSYNLKIITNKNKIEELSKEKKKAINREKKDEIQSEIDKLNRTNKILPSTRDDEKKLLKTYENVGEMENLNNVANKYREIYKTIDPSMEQNRPKRKALEAKIKQLELKSKIIGTKNNIQDNKSQIEYRKDKIAELKKEIKSATSEEEKQVKAKEIAQLKQENLDLKINNSIEAKNLKNDKSELSKVSPSRARRAGLVIRKIFSVLAIVTSAISLMFPIVGIPALILSIKAKNKVFKAANEANQAKRTIRSAEALGNTELTESERLSLCDSRRSEVISVRRLKPTLVEEETEDK